MKFRRVAALVVVAMFAPVLSGCGVPQGGAERRVRLPAALPPDVPLPERAHLRSAQDLGGKGLTMVFETDETVAVAGRHLRSRLEERGWVLLSEVVVESAFFFSYRDAGRSLALGISGTGGVTVVGLAYRNLEPEREGV